MATSHGWYDVQSIGPGVTAIVESGHAEHVHSYLIEGERDVAVLDTGMGVGGFLELVRSITDRNPVVLQSHAHWDHVGASAEFDDVRIHRAEARDLQRSYGPDKMLAWFAPEFLRGIPLPERFDPANASIEGTVASGYLEHGGRIDLGGRILEIAHTPGHSPGGITIYDEMSRLLFPGDALNLGPLYLFSDQADLRAYERSLAVLEPLAGRSDAIYPSHYEVPMTPGDVRATKDALVEIVAGRAPDTVNNGVEEYRFERFSYLIRQGLVEEFRT